MKIVFITLCSLFFIGNLNPYYEENNKKNSYTDNLCEDLDIYFDNNKDYLYEEFPFVYDLSLGFGKSQLIKMIKFYYSTYSCGELIDQITDIEDDFCLYEFRELFLLCQNSDEKFYEKLYEKLYKNFTMCINSYKDKLIYSEY